jgi:hypothetical protein
MLLSLHNYNKFQKRIDELKGRNGEECEDEECPQQWVTPLPYISCEELSMRDLEKSSKVSYSI